MRDWKPIGAINRDSFPSFIRPIKTPFRDRLVRAPFRSHTIGASELTVEKLGEFCGVDIVQFAPRYKVLESHFDDDGNTVIDRAELLDVTIIEST